jgi:putative ABC transport system ATP-binding protein
VSFLNENIIEMKNIIKSFYIGTPNQLDILKNIDITIKEGEFVAIVGASGSGKSTLMNIIGALDRQTSGTYILDDSNIDEVSDNGLSEIRNKKIGFVFQTFNLIPRSSALKNVELPMLYAGMGRKERLERSENLLKLVGMEDRMTHVPNELSGGQKQRVAIARALANEPSIILADEPTGALDSSTGRLVMDLFHKVHELEGKTIVFITHNHELAQETERIITLKDGNIVSEEYNKSYVRKFPDGEKICL